MKQLLNSQQVHTISLAIWHKTKHSHTFQSTNILWALTMGQEFLIQCWAKKKKKKKNRLCPHRVTPLKEDMVHYKKTHRQLQKLQMIQVLLHRRIEAVRVYNGGPAWARRSERGIKDRSKGLTRWRVQLKIENSVWKGPVVGGSKVNMGDWNKVSMTGGQRAKLS